MLLNPKAFERCFSKWAQSIKDEGVLEGVTAIDGKTSRRTKTVSIIKPRFIRCMHGALKTAFVWGKLPAAKNQTK
jgi:hypothetical protein